MARRAFALLIVMVGVMVGLASGQNPTAPAALTGKITDPREFVG